MPCSDENDTNPICNDLAPDDYEDVRIGYTYVEVAIVDQPEQNDKIE